MNNENNKGIPLKNDIEEVIYLKKIGERLKYFRKKAGYSNYEYFAYDHNISRPQYGKYEAGANIQLNTLIKILKAMNISLEEFFKGIDIPKSKE
jgi:transcriptional regulator with XRE-family HTH domain